jgi:hypothetical protein
MRGNRISRGMGIAVAVMAVAAIGTFGRTANAQTVGASDSGCWIDSATGQPHVFSPHSGTLGAQERDAHQASYGGHNYFVDPASGSWVDSATGQPHVFSPHSGTLGAQERDAHQASYGGHNYFFRVPCQPPSTASSTIGGSYLGGISPDGNSGVRFFVNAEGGFAGAKAFYDDLSIDPRSFIGGASVGVRVYQPYNMFLGAQVSVLGTDLTKEAVPGFSVGLRWGVPVDIQVGRTFQTGATPFSVYGFAGPMWGGTRVSSFGATDNFTLFGATAGLGLDVYLNQNWSVGAKARAFTLGPSDSRSDGQHVQGGSLTVNVGYRF